MNRPVYIGIVGRERDGVVSDLVVSLLESHLYIRAICFTCFHLQIGSCAQCIFEFLRGGVKLHREGLPTSEVGEDKFGDLGGEGLDGILVPGLGRRGRKRGGLDRLEGGGPGLIVTTGSTTTATAS